MIEISVSKALAVEEAGSTERCHLCALEQCGFCSRVFICNSAYRKDGKDVVFKLVDLPAKKAPAVLIDGAPLGNTQSGGYDKWRWFDHAQ